MKNYLENLLALAASARWGALCIATMLILGAAADRSAAQDTITSFTISLSSSEQVLAFPEDDLVMHYQSWDSPLQRVIERNMPFIEVANSATSTENITEFRLTIGDEDFNFADGMLGAFAVIGETTPNISIDNTSGGDVLVVTFEDEGIAPGEAARFQIDIDADPDVTSFVYPDYRTVLFDLNGDDDSDNAVATVIYSTDDGPLAQNRRLPDFSQDGPIYVNGNLRPYSVMEMVEYFSAPIPEPATAMLAATMLLGLGAVRRRM